MKLLKDNESIVLSGDEAISVLTEVEYILISLRDIARHYYNDPDENPPEKRALYCNETTTFIDENHVTERLAKIRKILTEKFNLELGDDDMDDLERAMQDVSYWKPSSKR